MAISGNLAEPIKGRLDQDGRLVAADPSLMRLHLHGGGFEGGKLAIPQLAELCRLSKKLNMNLSRAVMAADEDVIINMWVETRIQGVNRDDGISISIVDWTEKPVSSNDNDDQGRRRDFDRLKALGSIRTDASLRILSLKMPGNDPGDVSYVGRPLLEVFNIAPPSRQVKFVEAIAERQPIRNQNARFTNDDTVNYVLRGQPLISSEGAYSGYRFSIGRMDSTQEELLSAVGPEDRLISKSLFGAQLGPALRQPLGKIIANAETIGSKLEGPLRGDYASYAKDIADAGRHLMDLVNDLTDLEAIDRDGFTTADDEIDLIDLAHRAAGLLAVKASDHQIRIDLPDEEKKQPAIGEFRRVLQILVNIIGNAIRYSPDGSVIKVRVKLEDDLANITVADQGDGIAEEDQEKIFSKFERLGRSGDGGSGLGLFISRRLARAMGGDLVVASKSGQGATFTLSIPAGK